MMLPKIRCWNQSRSIPSHSFFLLCKGDNAGKPGLKPWPNSFIITCSNKQYHDFFYWLSYALHQTGKFKTRHRGSAIPFINLNDVRDLFRELAPEIQPHWTRLAELIIHLDNLSKMKTSLEEQLKASEKLQIALLQKFCNNRK